MEILSKEQADKCYKDWIMEYRRTLQECDALLQKRWQENCHIFSMEIAFNGGFAK